MAKRNQWTRFARSPNLSEGAFSKNLPIASIVPKDSVEACRHASETDWNYVIEAKRCLVIRAIGLVLITRIACPSLAISAPRIWSWPGLCHCAARTYPRPTPRSNVENVPMANTINSNRSILVFIALLPLVFGRHRCLPRRQLLDRSGQADRRDFSCW
jgi:hypothetical protein